MLEGVGLTGYRMVFKLGAHTNSRTTSIRSSVYDQVGYDIMTSTRVVTASYEATDPRSP